MSKKKTINHELFIFFFIKKGDRLVLQCFYDSTKDDKEVYGGLSTNEEMCLAFLHYYPRLPISGCESTPSFYQVAEYFQENQTIQWTNEKKENLQKLAYSNKVKMDCQDGNIHYKVIN